MNAAGSTAGAAVRLFGGWPELLAGVGRSMSRGWLTALVIVGGVLPILIAIVTGPRPVPLERALGDLKVRLRSRCAPVDPRVVLVEIDERSLRGVRHRWPWPRAVFADLIASLSDRGPRLIAIDLLFARPDPTADGGEGDRRFAAAMRRAGNVVLLAPLIDRPRGSEQPVAIEPPWPDFASAARALAYTELMRESDGVGRAVTCGIRAEPVPAMVSLLAGTLTDGAEFRVAREPRSGRVWITPVFDVKRRLRRRSIVDLLDDRHRVAPRSGPMADAGFDLTGAVVLIGVTAPILHDVHPTPVGRRAGVEIIAAATNSLVTGWQAVPLWLSGGQIGFNLLVVICACFTVGHPAWPMVRQWRWLAGGVACGVTGNVLVFVFGGYDFQVVPSLAAAAWLCAFQQGLRWLRDGLDREALGAELGIARRMQESLLPRVVPQPPGWAIAGRTEPASDVGGDFFHLHLLADGRLVVVVVDVAGKGLQAGLFASLSSVLIKQESARGRSPGIALRAINDALRHHFDGLAPSYLTACYAVIDPAMRRLTVATAGHEPPLLVTPDGHLRTLDVVGPPLGPVWLFPDQNYSEAEVQLVAGEKVVFSTDGFVEAFDGHDTMLGRERFRRMVAAAASLAPGDLLARIFAEVDAFEAPAPRADDRTLVVLEPVEFGGAGGPA